MIARVPQFSMIIQVQERLTPQSNLSHEQSTLKFLIFGFNKKLPRKNQSFHYVNTENQAADIFNCKNTPILCNNSSSGKIDSSIESIARTKHIEVAHLCIQQEVAKKSERRIF
jgi:hypothetical protein